MEHTTYASRLRFLDADDVNDAVVDYDGLDVRGPDGDRLGDVDGFIVDAQAGRVYYVVVDAGGWFSSKRMLLPIGHAALDANSGVLNVDVTRDALMRYPEFDEDRFRAFTDEDLRAFESRMVDACCPSDAETTDASVRSWAYDTRKHYAQPSWWRASYPAERLRPVESPATRAMASHPPIIERSSVPVGGAVRVEHERVTAREGSQRDDVSPHFEGRAQPGDVLGIETGGERTYVGETAQDEDERRRDAERAVEKDPPRQSER
jgi:PRC-barrel domain